MTFHLGHHWLGVSSIHRVKENQDITYLLIVVNKKHIFNMKHSLNILLKSYLTVFNNVDELFTTSKSSKISINCAVCELPPYAVALNICNIEFTFM